MERTRESIDDFSQDLTANDNQYTRILTDNEYPHVNRGNTHTHFEK